MRACKVRKLAVLAIVAGIVAFVAKKLRGEPAPQFSNHPTVRGGPDAKPTVVPAPPLVPAPTDPTVAAPADAGLVPAPTDPTVPTPEVPAADEPTDAAAPEAEPEAASIAAEHAWVEPVDGTCPDGYPVKAKVKSGIFHVPGSPTYERTKPDRCYASAEAAEADGLRPPKR